ncbi:hypothetical protein SISNIDRAFT_471710 [Sistotremastrum niveocremeum HHB9708]|uniref:Uncharacterized protein n=1 Tax=Sistotremastrum niveocremeum HHB9708 TaxID=1314777 RepID=A0A164MAS0_9AGAM|nr:hypothetical protein SISNIDRAFT_471710 [Sistotremastrum niveocremeum HHB9708]
MWTGGRSAQISGKVCHDHYTAKMIAEEQEHAARNIKVSEKALIKASSKAQRGQFTFPVQAVSPGHRSRSATSGANPGGPPISGSASLTHKMQTHGTQKSGSKMIAGVQYNVKADPDVVEVKDGGAIVVDAFLGYWNNGKMKWMTNMGIIAEWGVTRGALKQQMLDTLETNWLAATHDYPLHAWQTALYSYNNSISLDIQSRQPKMTGNRDWTAAVATGPAVAVAADLRIYRSSVTEFSEIRGDRDDRPQPVTTVTWDR